MKNNDLKSRNGLAVLLLTLGCFFCFTTVFAQSNAEIYGKILDVTTSEPLPGTNVVVVNIATGFKAGAITDFNGKFTIRDLQLGGPYTVTVSFVGYKTIVQKGYQLGLGDKLKLNFNMSKGEEILDEVVITASSSDDFSKRENLGSAVSITGKTLEKIPTTSRNYEDLANLSPLSTPRLGLNEGSAHGGISVAGSNGGGTGFTLDGVNNRRSVFGGTADGPAFTISMEAIREFEIVTNSYDVSGPRSSGGAIKAVTRSGSNNWGGATWSYGSGGSLSGDRNFNGSKREVDFSNKQFGARISGPIIKDKLNFLAVFDKFNQNSPVGSGSNSAGFINFKSGQNYPFVQSDVQNYVDHLATLGVLKSKDISSQIGETVDDKTTTNIFLKLDWNINDINNLSLRYNDLDYVQSFQAGADGFDKVTLFSRGYPFFSKDKKVIAGLKTRLTDGSNNLKVSFGRTERVNSLAKTRTPRISVAQLNNVDTHKVGAGLATWVPEELYSNNFQIINVLTKKIGKNTYTFGTDILINKIDENIPHNTASSFRYNSLANFQAGEPFYFDKKFSLDPNDEGRLKYTTTEIAFFVQGEYDLTDNLKLEAGLRWDGTIFEPDQDPTNTKLKSVMYKGEGLVNDSKLRDFNNFQPRVNLTWDRNGDGSEIIKLGVGFFSSQFTTQPYTFTLGNSGSRFVKVSTQDITQLKAIHKNFTDNGGWGDLDKQITLKQYSAITGENPKDIAADVTVLDPDFDMPMTFKASGSYHKFFNSWFRLGASLYYNNTKNVPYFSDINLKESGKNILDGRTMYDNGKNPDFGRILIFQNSDWRATFYAAVFEAYAKLPKGGNISFSYTKSASKGSSFYNAGGGFDGSRPLTYQYDSYSVQAVNWHDGNSIPNKIVFSFVSPEVKGFTLSGSLVAGQFGRFSAQSGVKTGANGQSLAYIPTDAEVISTQLKDPSDLLKTYNPYKGFAQMLSSTSSEYRDYINKNRGTFADFNGGAQAWSYSTNMSLIKGFSFAKKHKLTARMDVFNALNLLGGYTDGAFNTVANTNLINVSDKNKYSIAKEAGRYEKGGDPFRVQLGLKYEF